MTASRFKALTVGLFYPAVVGAGVILVLQRFSGPDAFSFTWLGDPVLHFALVLLLLFSGSFLGIQQAGDEHYDVAAFILDLVEVALIFLAFSALGLTAAGAPPPPQLGMLYLVLILICLVHFLWSWRIRTRWAARLNYVRFAIIGLALLGADSAVPWLSILNVPDYAVRTGLLIVVLVYLNIWDNVSRQEPAS